MPAINLVGNIRKFIWFGVLYNARAYYPVLAILFIDLGLTLDQFIFLNLIWALTIFLFEVPSGALADVIGRRKLLIIASILMVLEMLFLLGSSIAGTQFVFLLCMFNRICSGLSEAFASGSDEALAYDSLPDENRQVSWDKVLATSMRIRSLGFAIAMVLGGLFYDPKILNQWLPQSLNLSLFVAHKLPVIIVLSQGVICFFITISMTELPMNRVLSAREACKNVLYLTWKTMKSALNHPRLVSIMVIGLMIDSVVRNFATINSSYYRAIKVPEWSYGFIGASVGLLGLLIPSLAEKLNLRFSIQSNFKIIAVIVFFALLMLAAIWPIWGVIPTMILMSTLGFLSFTISRSLHSEADSSNRATLLSVKGLVFNLGYALFSLIFSKTLSELSFKSSETSLSKILLWQVPFYFFMMLFLFLWIVFGKSLLLISDCLADPRNTRCWR
jgi:MFS family permease